MDKDKLYEFLWDLQNLIREYNTAIVGINYHPDLLIPIYIELEGIGQQKYELLLRKKVQE